MFGCNFEYLFYMTVVSVWLSIALSSEFVLILTIPVYIQCLCRCSLVFQPSMVDFLTKFFSFWVLLDIYCWRSYHSNFTGHMAVRKSCNDFSIKFYKLYIFAVCYAVVIHSCLVSGPQYRFATFYGVCL